MTLIKNWTIAGRVSAGGGALCLLFAVGIAVNVQRQEGVCQAIRSLATAAVPHTGMAALAANLRSEAFLLVEDCGRATSPEERQPLKARLSELSERLGAADRTYESAVTEPQDKALVAALNAAQSTYLPDQQQYLHLLDLGQAAQAASFLNQRLFPGYHAVSDATDDLLQYNASRANTLAAAAAAEAERTRTLMIEGTLISCLIAVAIGYGLVRGLTTILSGVTRQLSSNADQTAAAAAQVSTSSQSLADGATAQAASLEQTSASLEEISSMTKRNAESATQAKALSNQTRQAAEGGAASMAEMKQAMDAIKESSNSIAKIVKTIDEIAFQTNILALNAAVEAARAGEAGAGFAVVADEVRSLAQRSAQSAKETAVKIEDSVSRSEHGVRISAKVAASFAEIVAKARSVDELVGEIASGSGEQSQGIAQVSLAVAKMDQVTQSNAACAEQSAAASDQLTSQSDVMRDSVEFLERLVGSRRGGPAPVGIVDRTVIRLETPEAPSTPPVPGERRNGRSGSHASSNGHGANGNGAHAHGSNGHAANGNGSGEGHGSHREFFN
jgi:methyl-accepting chemotaxis protein